MRAFRGEGSFAKFLKTDAEVATKLSPIEIDALFDTRHHLKNVDVIFGRVSRRVKMV